MRTYIDRYSVSRIYIHVWMKYRPVILKLMIASEEGPQQYKFSDHEFRRVNPKEKGGYAFTMNVFQGKAVTDIRASAPAQDLLWVLQQSRKATELVESSTYEFMFDKRFVLHVARWKSAIENIPEPQTASQPSPQD